MAEAGLTATYSYAGRVDMPRPQPLPTRVGGFGGVDGLCGYIRDHEITHLVDATHPFAAQMSHNAKAACLATGIELAALTRPEWDEVTGDRWTRVPDVAAAAAALSGPARRVFLAVGRMHLDAFAVRPQHHYLLRLVDEPETLPLPDAEVVVARGPFSVAGDRALMQAHKTDLVVSKNAGGSGARAKLDAARELGVEVMMIDRPTMPPRLELRSSIEVLDWLDHG